MRDAFPLLWCRSRRKAPRALSGKARKLRRREHGTPGHSALPRAVSRAAVRSAPSRDRAEAGLYGVSAKRQGKRTAGWSGGARSAGAPIGDPLQQIGKPYREVDTLAELACTSGIGCRATQLVEPVEQQFEV